MLSILYLGTYVVLVKAEPLSSMSGEGGWPRVPEYSVGGEFAQRLFHPIQRVDIKVRRRYWLFSDDDMTKGDFTPHQFSDYFK